MPRKYKQDVKTGLVPQSLSKVTVGGVLFFGILVIGSTILPYYSRDYLYISIPAAILGFTSLIWINLHPNLYARFFLNLGIAILWITIASRAFENILPHFSLIGTTLIFITVIFSHTLPMWNSSVANFLRDELAAPRTKLGKIIFRISLVLIPFVGIVGAVLESILYREGKSRALSFILLCLFWLGSIILPFAYRFPSSPWESKKNQS